MTTAATHKTRRPRPRLKPPEAAQSQSAGATGATSGTATPQVNFTPEELAYALPGGLAKLAYPNWIYGPHLRYIEDRVLQIAAGKPTFIMVSTPPRHGKTMFLSRIVPSWFLGRFPDKRVILITHTADFSRTQSRAARNVFEAYGPKVFDVEISADTASASEWNVAGHEGGMEAVGAGSSVQGKGADLLIMDDLVKGYEMATNLAMLEKQWEWFLADVYPRLEPGASVLLTMTRWSAHDIIGMIENAQQEGLFKDWETVNFPAFAKKDDPLGREPGAPLFPERISTEMLLDRKATMEQEGRDELWWSALYLGNPIPAKGNIVDADWFRRADALPTRAESDMVVLSADTASKETEISDFTAIGVWFIKDELYYLVEVIRDKFQYPELVNICKALNATHRPEFFLIEDKGSGVNLIQDLRSQDFSINVWPMDPGNESKVIRMQAETATLRSGRVYIPKDAAWIEDYLMEMRSFPKGRRDQVDMTSQALKFLRMQTINSIRMWTW